MPNTACRRAINQASTSDQNAANKAPARIRGGQDRPEATAAISAIVAALAKQTARCAFAVACTELNPAAHGECRAQVATGAVGDD